MAFEIHKWTDRQANTQTTDKHTDTMTAILRTPTAGKVTTLTHTHPSIHITFNSHYPGERRLARLVVRMTDGEPLFCSVL